MIKRDIDEENVVKKTEPYRKRKEQRALLKTNKLLMKPNTTFSGSPLSGSTNIIRQ